jgi:hypothetical protein
VGMVRRLGRMRWTGSSNVPCSSRSNSMHWQGAAR